MHNPRFRHKKPAAKKTMELQKRLLKELGRQDMSAGEAAFFFNYVQRREWKDV